MAKNRGKTVANSRAMAIGERMFLKFAEEVEREYAEDRKTAAEQLQNALAAVIVKQRPSVETVLYVLEVLRAQVLEQALREGEPAAEVEPGAGIPVSDELPRPRGVAVDPDDERFEKPPYAPPEFDSEE